MATSTQGTLADISTVPPLHDCAWLQLVALAETHGVTPASVVLRWLLQRGIAAIPKTTNPSRLVENLRGPFGWVLNDDEMRRISTLDEGLHCRGDDPKTMA